MVFGVQRMHTGTVEAVIGDIRRQHDFQTAQARIGHGAGKGFQMVFTGPIKSLPEPAGLANIDGCPLVEAGQGSTERSKKILVADDSHLPTARSAGKGFEGRVTRFIFALPAEAVDLPQVEP